MTRRQNGREIQAPRTRIVSTDPAVIKLIVVPDSIIAIGKIFLIFREV